ncbi:hypothetical protein AAKU55_002495 [Oxalobacteraceae bacterium GrIS 1.11]
MNNLFSLSTLGFYSVEFLGEYVSAGTLPSDAVSVGAATEQRLRDAIGRGDTIVPDGAGGFTVTPAPAPPFAPIAAAYLDTVRVIREQALNRLAGIGFSALQSGDTATAQAVAVARQALLDITKAPAVLAASDAGTLKAAVLATYRAIAVATPENIRKAFKREAM